jgi:hypothetical protein
VGDVMLAIDVVLAGGHGSSGSGFGALLVILFIIWLIAR